MARGHASYHDNLLVLSVREALINLRTIEEFERNLLYDTVFLVNVARELHNHMRITIGHNEALFEDEVFRVINSHERARAIAQIPQVVLLVDLVILNDHVSLTDASLGGALRHLVFSETVIHTTLRYLHLIPNHEVVVVLAGDSILLLAADDGATVLAHSLTRHEALRVDRQLVADHGLVTLHDLYLQYRCPHDFFFRYERALDGLVQV